MIGYYVHHHGAGHAARARAVAAELEAIGEPVTGFSSLPRPDGWHGPWHVLERDDQPEPGAAADVTAGGALHWAPQRHRGFAGRMGRLARWLADEQPACLVVDVSVEVTLLGRLLGVPTVVMAMRGQRDDAPHVSAYDAATVLVAPWPDSLPEPWWPRRWLDKTVHVGGMSRFDDQLGPAGEGSDTPGRPGHGLLLWGRGGSAPALDELRAALPEWSWSLPSGEGPEVWRELTAAGLVVCHAGQNAVAEVAAARRPAVVVADPRPFDEQEHTVAALEAGRLAATAPSWPTADQWPALVETALALGGDRWRVWNDGGGARRAALAIRDIGHRDPGRVTTPARPPAHGAEPASGEETQR